MKLSQGEYVALEKIENVYAACPVAQQIYVHGDSMQPYLLAVVVPDPVVLAKIASGVWNKEVNRLDPRALNEAVKDERVVNAVLDMLTKDGVRYGLRGCVLPPPCVNSARHDFFFCRYEFVKRIHLTNEVFSVENNCLTPTMKVRRRDVQKKYKAELDALYALGEPKRSASPKL